MKAEVLFTEQESNNAFDRYAIAAVKRGGGGSQDKVVGHLPREISRFTWFIVSHGASVMIKVVDVRQRRSPLIQGGLEIPVEVPLKCHFPLPQASHRKILVNEHYEEPVDGVFKDYTSTVLSALDESNTDTEEDEQG